MYFKRQYLGLLRTVHSLDQDIWLELQHSVQRPGDLMLSPARYQRREVSGVLKLLQAYASDLNAKESGLNGRVETVQEHMRLLIICKFICAMPGIVAGIALAQWILY